MEKVILDTSVFVGQFFAKSPAESFNNFLSLAGKSKGYRFFMPPSVLGELKKFAEESEIDKQSLKKLKVKAPKKHELTVPAYLLYNLVMDMRKRTNKGLRIAENAVRSDGKIDEIIRTLRANYKEATREGIIDSREDVDLLLLAKELNGVLVTADKGLIFWAQELGIPTIEPEELKDRLVVRKGGR
jgi:hypothetical protein